MSENEKDVKNKGLSSPSSKTASVLRSAAAMSLGTLSSRVLGLVRDIILYAVFSRMVTDAFVVAFRLPNMFRRLLGEGALSASFVPVYVDYLQQESSSAASRSRGLSSTIFTTLLVLTSTLSVLGILVMEPLMQAWLSGKGYQEIPGKIELTVVLAQIMFVYLFLVTSYAFLMAVSQAHKRFLIPAMAPAAFNMCVIVFALLPQSWLSIEGGFLAIGVVVGGVVQASMVAVLLLRLKVMPALKWNWRTPGFLIVLRNMVPGLIGMGVLQILNIVNVAFASNLPQGSHSYIYLADRVLELPQSLIAISLGAAILPTLSEFWSKGDKESMWKTSHNNLKLLLFLSLPSAVGMFVLAQPIVEVLFMRSGFKPEEAVLTAQIVQVYSVLLIASSVNKVTIPSFFAIKNTWLPAVVSTICVLMHIGLAPKLMAEFGLVGLVGSTAISGLLNVSIILLCYRLMIGPVWSWRLIKFVGSLLPALLALGAAAYFGNAWVRSLLDFMPGQLQRGVALLVTISASIVVYFFLNSLFKIEESASVLGVLRRRVRR